MRSRCDLVVLALGAALAVGAACKVSVGGRPSGAATTGRSTAQPPVEAAALTEAHATIVGLLRARQVQRCDAGEGQTAREQTACAEAHAAMTIQQQEPSR